MGRDGRTEVLLIHRPRYDDWTLPKGKCDQGEPWEDTAHREVLEETGFEVELGAELPSVAYRDHKGRTKLVRYWTMSVRSGTFAPNDEVDAIAWLSTADARSRLSYEHDTVVLDAFEVPAN
ncbi:MAG: NUDIX hydrolase [Aquihabitans sp.]